MQRGKLRIDGTEERRLERRSMHSLRSEKRTKRFCSRRSVVRKTSNMGISKAQWMESLRRPSALYRLFAAYREACCAYWLLLLRTSCGLMIPHIAGIPEAN